MLTISICDDDVHILNYLSSLCAHILPDSVIHEYTQGREFLCKADTSDIVLMDIQMKDMDGLEVVRQLRSRTTTNIRRLPTVIFISAHVDYVFEALDLFAFHYLIKPLDEEKFEKVLRQAAEECREAAGEEALFFHTKSSHLRLCPSQILYVESNLRKVVIHTEKEDFEIYATMGQLENLLGSLFYRCHRGYLVNLGKIEGYDRQSIRLSDGSSLLLSKPRYGEFVDTYMHFLKRRQ